MRANNQPPLLAYYPPRRFCSLSRSLRSQVLKSKDYSYNEEDYTNDDDNSEEEIELLVTPRTFKTFKDELAFNNQRAESARQQTISGRIHNSPWWIETVRYTKDSLKGKQAPLCVLEFLAAVRQVIEYGFEFTRELMYKLMEEVLKAEDHKVYAVQRMTKRLREYVEIEPEEYLEWLKGKDIQPPAHLIREVKMMMQRKKNIKGGKDAEKRGGRRKRKKGFGSQMGMTPSLATLGEDNLGGDEEFDTDDRSKGGHTPGKMSMGLGMSLDGMMKEVGEGGSESNEGSEFGQSIQSGSQLSSTSKLLRQFGINEKRSIVDDNMYAAGSNVGGGGGRRRSSKMGEAMMGRRGSNAATSLLSPSAGGGRKMSLSYTT